MELLGFDDYEAGDRSRSFRSVSTLSRRLLAAEQGSEPVKDEGTNSELRLLAAEQGDELGVGGTNSELDSDAASESNSDGGALSPGALSPSHLLERRLRAASLTTQPSPTEGSPKSLSRAGSFRPQEGSPNIRGRRLSNNPGSQPRKNSQPSSRRRKLSGSFEKTFKQSVRDITATTTAIKQFKAVPKNLAAAAAAAAGVSIDEETKSGLQRDSSVNELHLPGSTPGSSTPPPSTSDHRHIVAEEEVWKKVNKTMLDKAVSSSKMTYAYHYLPGPLPPPRPHARAQRAWSGTPSNSPRLSPLAPYPPRTVPAYIERCSLVIALVRVKETMKERPEQGIGVH